MGIFIRLVLRRGVTIRQPYITRFLFLLQSAAFSSMLAMRERAIYRGTFTDQTSVRPPVFIIGHWRTGTTLLHQLMACDPALAAPTLFQCCYPHSFRSSRKFVEPVMKRFVTGTRPMDNVRVGMDEPQEEENALFRMTGRSPLEQLIFPVSGRYFLANHRCWAPDTPGRLEVWKDSLVRFVAKVQRASGERTIVLKNPFNCLRIGLLKKLFPGARYIFIERNPRLVIPSAVHMWSIVGAQNAMRKEWRAPSFEDVALVFRKVSDRINNDRSTIDPRLRATVRFESLENSPVETIQSLYNSLGLAFTAAYRRRIESFLADSARFQKNAYPINASHQQLLNERLGETIRRLGY